MIGSVRLPIDCTRDEVVYRHVFFIRFEHQSTVRLIREFKVEPHTVDIAQQLQKA